MTPFTGTFYIVVQRFFFTNGAGPATREYEAVVNPESNQVSLDQIVRDIRHGQYGDFTPYSIDAAQVIEVDLVKGTATDITKRVIELAECAA